MGEREQIKEGGFREAIRAARAELTAEKLIDRIAEVLVVVGAVIWSLKITELYGPLAAFVSAHSSQVLRSTVLYLPLYLLLYLPAALAVPLLKALVNHLRRRKARRALTSAAADQPPVGG